jgi:hypothetical protein
MLVALAVPAAAQDPWPAPPLADRVRLAEALRVGDAAAIRPAPPPAEFQALPDYAPYAETLAQAEAALRRELRGLDLVRDRREVFYLLGAALALPADRVGEDWMRRCAEDKLRRTGITELSRPVHPTASPAADPARAGRGPASTGPGSRAGPSR